MRLRTDSQNQLAEGDQALDEQDKTVIKWGRYFEIALVLVFAFIAYMKIA